MIHHSGNLRIRFAVALPILLLLGILGAVGAPAWANTITAASPSLADVSAAIANAAPGDTIMIPSGSATWTQGLVITKSVKVIGAGVGKTIITRNFAGDFLTYLIKYAPDANARAADAFFRWSGCTFIFTGQSGSCFDLFNRPAQTPMTKNRIDHCEFVGVDMNARVLQVDGMIWGVFDNNRITSGTLEVYGSNEVSWTYFTATPGGADNFFFEDNVIAYTGINYGFGSGVGGRYCARHNTIDATGITDYAVQLADIHGSMYTGGNLSSMICEIYDNTILANGKGVILGDLRGGQGFIYNNTVYSNQSAYGPIVREELMDTICPPANNVLDGSPQHVHNSYVFNNYRSENGILERLGWTPNGTVDYAAGQTDTSNGRYYPPAEPYRVVPLENLDFWVEASSFTGASGIGVGLLSARPSTGAKDGVGYWATDAKTLYRWTAAGGWQAYYKPYAYPHPLRDDSTIPPTLTLPSVTTSAVSGISTTGAVAGGNVSADGGAAVTARGVCWGASANPAISGSHTSDGTGTGAFTSALSGLSQGTTYHVRAYAVNSAGTAYGADVTFATGSSTGTLPTVTTSAVSGITATGAAAGGNVTSAGGGTVSARGVCWGASANPTVSGSHTSNGTGTGAFTSALSGLSQGTAYHVRAYAVNSAGTAYGADVTFTTSASGMATVTTAAISGVSASGAISGGNVTSAGGSSITARGVCWGAAANPTVSGSHTSDGTGAGGFTSTLSGLSQGVKYHARAYATNSAGTAYGSDVAFMTQGLRKRNTDFNGDGLMDILWRHSVTGENLVWLQGSDGTAFAGLQGLELIAANSPAEIRLTASADRDAGSDSPFTGSAPKVFWSPAEAGPGLSEKSSGALFEGVRPKDATWTASLGWTESVMALTPTYVRLPIVADTSWQIAGAADFNRDGLTDILWRNSRTGENYVWLMNGMTKTSGIYLPTVADASFQIFGTGDFNGDGETDLLWRNAATGENIIWYMSGTTLLSYVRIASVADGNWQIGGTGDFDKDGNLDILWRNYATGENYIWYMNGTTRVGGAYLQRVTDANWQIVGTGDVDGDGNVDILWRNCATGDNIVWYMDGATMLSYVRITSIADLSWKIVGR